MGWRHLQRRDMKETCDIVNQDMCMEPRCAGHSSQTCSPLRPGRSPGHRLTRAWHLAWHIDARMPSRTLTPNHVGTRVSCWSNEVYTSALWLESGSPQSSSYRYSRTGELRKTKSESLAPAARGAARWSPRNRAASHARRRGGHTQIGQRRLGRRCQCGRRRRWRQAGRRA